MRQILQNERWELDASATVNEVEEIYEAYILKKKLEGVTGSKLTNVPYPILPADCIDEINNLEKNSDKDANAVVDQIICDLDFSEGGQFIACREELTDDILPSLLELFATLVEYKENVRYTKFDHKVYRALPSYFVEMANGSRHDSGFRLLRRCTRHAMDQ